MIENQNRPTIGFNFENEFGDKFSSTTTVGLHSGQDFADIDLIGRQLNIFLRQCGYYRKNDCILMEDVTEEERETLANCLAELRKEKK